MAAQPTIFGEQLPSINSVAVAATLTWGALLRPVIWGSFYHGVRAFLGTYVRRDEKSCERNWKNFQRTVYSSIAEVGLSVAFVPARYLAAMHCTRLLIDFANPSFSDALAVVDRFNAGTFMAFAQHAFLSSVDEEWNMDFFVFQLPSIALTIGKLIARRRKIGAAKCRTKRVLGMLFLQVVLRAFTGSFTVQLPQSEGDLITALIAISLEGLTSKYLIYHTWPFLE
ncbi:Hypothetical protein, putative [Bodo saltans]|uniref:Uncharacterized protein n=1 Tax=Bodo saltans TaxID=75058 RepID=A0A0S4ILA8_BODSA|nr:Hypothetical protein, putative [Bodo saltans]|eukprot:CUF23750.1 Hypothetical protein, putative [Bodo saltans]